MLGGGLLPGTLTVVYGATGIGKTHLGLAFGHHGVRADGAAGIVFDMNVRGDSQQHHAYAVRLHQWDLKRWTHSVLPMAHPYPPTEQMEAFYCDALPWVGKLRDYQVATSDGLEFDWNWKAQYNQTLYAVRPFVYFHLGAGSRRIVVDGKEDGAGVYTDCTQIQLLDVPFATQAEAEEEEDGRGECEAGGAGSAGGGEAGAGSRGVTLATICSAMP